MKHLGRPHTLNLSDYAKEALKQHLEGRTSYYNPTQGQPKKNPREALKLAHRHAKAYSDYSTIDLAAMDRQGIKLLGVEFEYDYSDTSWAE